MPSLFDYFLKLGLAMILLAQFSSIYSNELLTQSECHTSGPFPLNLHPQDGLWTYDGALTTIIITEQHPVT